MLIHVCVCATKVFSQTTISSDGFENALSSFTVTTGTATYYSGNSAAADAPASSPFKAVGTYALGVTNGTLTITSSAVNTSLYNNLQLSVRLAAFSIGATTNGLDAADYVQIEVSPDNGTTYYNTVKVTGNGTTNGAYWSYTGGTGNASTPYDGDATAVVFTPAGLGSRTTDGYSTITITSLPSVANLKVRFTLVCNNNERWVIDDYKLTGLADPASFTANTSSTTQINLAATANASGDNVMIAYNTTSTFGTPVSGSSYSVGGAITGGGTVLYRGTASGVTNHTGLTPNTIYYYKTFSYNGSNNYSAGITANATTICNPPVASAATLSTGTGFKANWTAPSGIGSATYTYTIEVSTDNSFSTGVTTNTGISSGTLSKTYSTLSSQTLYYYRIKTVNAGGNSTYSSTISKYTLSSPPTAAASSFTAISAGSNQVNVSWTSATFPATGASATGYIILRRQDGATPGVTNVTGGTAPSSLSLPSGTTLAATITSGSTTSFSDAGLSSNTTYSYIIIPFTWDGTNPETYNYYTSIYPYTTSTTCNSIFSIPFSESFENSGNIPSCWSSTTVATGTTAPLITYVTSSSNPTVSAPAQGSYFVKFNSYDASSGAQARLVSPAINSSGYSSLQLTFQWYLDNSSGYTNNNDNIQVQYSLDGIAWNSISNAMTRYGYTSGWTTESVDLPAGAVGQATVYIGFLFSSDYGDNCHLDNVNLDVPVPKVTITQNHPAAGNIYQGSTNNIIAMLQLDASNFNITPTSVSLLTAGTYTAGDFSNFKLYQNTSNDLTGTPTLVQTITSPGGSGTTITFSGAGFTAISPGSTNFLILTADVASGATAAHTVSISSTAFTNLNFTSTGGTVTKAGTNPVAASNTQTIQTATITISAAHPATGNIAINTKSDIIAGLQLTAAGNITPSSITFTLLSTSTCTSPADITNFTLWQNSTNSIGGATLVGSVITSAAAGTNITFNSGFSTISSGATAYLLLTVDVTSSATAGRTISITSTSFTNLSFAANGTITKSGTNPVTAGNVQTVSNTGRFWSGTNNWDGSTTVWGTASGSYNSTAWLANGNATFEGTAGTVTFAAPVAAQQLNFNTSGYSFTTASTSNYLSLANSSIVNIATGSATFGANGGNPAFAGSNGLVKTGSGELVVRARLGYTGASTFTGSISVNQGSITMGDKSYTSSYPRFHLNNNSIILNNGTLNLAEGYAATYFNEQYQYGFQNYGNAGLSYLPSFTSTGNSTILLYNTSATAGPLAAEMLTSSSNTRMSTTNGTPLSISGQLTIDYGGNISTPASYVAFGSTNFTGPVTIQLKGNGTVNTANNTGIMTNLNLGGIGTYINGSIKPSGTITDNGYSLTVYGGGSATSDGGFVCLNSPGTFTGDWIIGKTDGTEAAYLMANNIDAMTSGTITVNDNSMFTYTINNTLTKGSYTLTHAPKQIIMYGRGPVSYPTSFDFYNFAKGANTVIFPSTTEFIIHGSPTTDMTTIGVQYPGLNNSSNTQEALQLNGPLTGTGGLDKYGVGILILNAQNSAGLINSYGDTTRIRQGTITVLYGSNLGTGALVMAQTTGLSTLLNLNNSAQSFSFLSTIWNDVTGSYTQIVNLNGTTLTLTGNYSTTYGNGAVSTLKGIITGTGNIIKEGTSTFILTGQNTYSGLTQIKNGTVRLNCSEGSTLLSTNSVHIVGGILRVSTSQTLKDVIVSTGTLQVDDGVTLTITGTLTLVNGTINLNSSGKISYQAGAKLVYGGSAAQTATSSEWPSINPPSSITFNNYSGVTLTGSSYNQVANGGVATVNGWLDFNGYSISGTGGFTLNGLTSVASLTGNTTSGSPIITNVSSTTSLAIGMLISGTNIPSGSYIIYIDPLVPNSVKLNNNATVTATNVSLSANIRGGLKVSMPHGIGDGTTGNSGGHVQVTGTKIYNSGASYIFNTPTSGTTISPAFPTVGTLNFSPAWDVTISAGVNNKVIMNTTSSDLAIDNNLSLTSGIWATNNNLITWTNNGGTLTAPNIPWSSSNTNFNDSYICTCDATGTEITATGNNGFRINNIGSSSDVYFPIGTDFVSANRMMINNSGTTDNFTVVVGKGDIGLTVQPKVNRIWYVSESVSGGSTVTMRLFFIKRNWSSSTFGAGQDEVENGFMYNDPHLVQRNTAGQFFNNASGSDVLNFSNNTSYPYNTSEIYGLYTRSVSADLSGNTNGIVSFYRFSVINVSNIILPVTIINFKAYQKENDVAIDWQVLNEINIDHYEVEKSINGINFNLMGKVDAINNGIKTNYSKIDPDPVNGNNFYRIKAIDKNGTVSYTGIAVVNIQNDKTSVSIQPNPVQNKIVNLFCTMPKGKYEFVLYNSNGQNVFRKSLEYSGGSSIQTLILPSNIASGIYVARLFNNKENFALKLAVE